MSTYRILGIVVMVLFGLLLIALINEGSSVEVVGLSVQVWIVALVAYILGWGATVALMRAQNE